MGRAAGAAGRLLRDAWVMSALAEDACQQLLRSGCVCRSALLVRPPRRDAPPVKIESPSSGTQAAVSVSKVGWWAHPGAAWA